MSETTRTIIAPPLLKKSRLVEKTSGGPTLQEAAVEMLRKALKTTFAQLQVDPDDIMLMTPVWHQHGQKLLSHSSRFESLPHALARLAFTGETANYIEGEHFLTVAPDMEDPVHLPVGMDAISTMLNENAPALFLAFAQSQLDYWNATEKEIPRWQQLADTLKETLDVQSIKGWDTNECSLARHVSAFPDKASRATTHAGLSDVRASLIDLDLAFELAEANQTRHLMVAGALVLTAKLDSRELVTMYTIDEGFESFSSLAELGATLPERIDMELSGQTLKWRLYEPDGNIFDAMVRALVSCQIDSIDALDPMTRSPLVRFISPQEHSDRERKANEVHVALLDKAIPDWLITGSLDDIQTYSGYLTELGRLRDADSDSFDVNEIALIADYAQQQMQDAIVAAKPAKETTQLLPDQVRITITHSFEAGGLTLPDPFSTRVQTLGEFALYNTRPYLAKVAYADATSTPDWLTLDLLLRLAGEVNIGENYPKLLKKNLIDDAQQARFYKDRYCQQLPLLLPLLALECKLKRQGDVDEQGYRQVRQLIKSIADDTDVADWPVQIRPLAFMPRFRLSSTPDTVANMYLISPAAGTDGPCLLYRPLLDQPLRQFPSAQNMLYALYQPGELRDSILAWLPTRALSFDYAQYVFSTGLPSPWTLTELAFEPFIHLDLTAAVSLADTPMSKDIYTTLFTSHSQALADLADRQSTSNAERRWAILADSGWAIFGVAANFLSGPAGTAVWVWQTIAQIQQALDANERSDTAAEWSSIGDVLLTLGILLGQRIAVRRLRLSSPLGENAALNHASSAEMPQPAPLLRKEPTITHDATPITTPLPDAHLSLLAPVALTRIDSQSAFLTTIDHMKVDKPSLSEGATPNADHLYASNGKLYAQVGERWFQVSAQADEPVFVLDPGDPAHPGLSIRFDTKAARWHWELRLRLRGGGPTGRIEALRRKKAKTKEETWKELHRFIKQEAGRKANLEEALKPLPEGDDQTPMSEDEITTYITKSDELATSYTQALATLEQWREAGGAGVFYQSQLMRMTVEQHRFLSGWLRMRLREYAKIVAPQLSTAEPAQTRSRQTQMEAGRKAIAVSDEMVERLGRLHASLDRLNHHSGETQKVAGDLKRLLPTFSRRDLHANEIGMSIELSLREAPESTLDPLRQLIVPIFEGAAEAGHALVERRNRAQPAETQAIAVVRLSALVDRLADAKRRLQDVFDSSAAQLQTERFLRVQQLVNEFHELARERLLKALPEPEEIPLAAMARLEPVPSSSRAVGRVNRARPQVIEPRRAAPEPPPVVEQMPVVRAAARRVLPVAALGDEALVDNAMLMSAGLEAVIKRLRIDAQRPSRIPADMKDLFDQQATRFNQAAVSVDEIFARRSADFPIANLGAELRTAATRLRREGVNIYGSMLTGRKPRESYLQWLHEHNLVQIVKDERGRIRTKQRQDFFQEYRILDISRQNKTLWVAHFHYDKLADPDEQFTAAHLKFADSYLQNLPSKSRQELEHFDAVDNLLRRIVTPAVRDLFLHPQHAGPAVA
ncbi:hypothetical protein C2E19_00610 [Pseudomonas sp. DTU12.3]|uniref:dermonecrotic toxin domain-containing protein n=1 Tax=Pseudomonas sp. DTU12.3 TaxID=2073078 RepID=UPI001010B03C|nr:DUF6543 domain-containing protein [Pseudomonas sp. DTU12.3]QAX82428.1 hypothetical protein C2E19_00610 [Pseudomonas sp. DTU12.3]